MQRSMGLAATIRLLRLHGHIPGLEDSSTQGASSSQALQGPTGPFALLTLQVYRQDGLGDKFSTSQQQKGLPHGTQVEAVDRRGFAVQQSQRQITAVVLGAQLSDTFTCSGPSCGA